MCPPLSTSTRLDLISTKYERSFGNVNPGLSNRVPLFFDANCGREGEKNSLTVCSPELHACRYRKCGSRCITWHNLIDLRSSLENLFYVCESTSCVGFFLRITLISNSKDDNIHYFCSSACFLKIFFSYR